MKIPPLGIRSADRQQYLLLRTEKREGNLIRRIVHPLDLVIREEDNQRFVFPLKYFKLTLFISFTIFRLHLLNEQKYAYCVKFASMNMICLGQTYNIFSFTQ